MKLRVKFNLGIILTFGILLLGISVITLYWSRSAAVKRAQDRLERSINSAWLIYNAKLEQIQLVTESLATTLSQELQAPVSSSLREKIEVYRQENELDILNLLDSEGTVIIRNSNPESVGDSLVANVLFKKALLTGKAESGTILIHPEQLEREGKDIVERCKKYGGETTGMFMLATVPLILENKCKGVLMAGVLLNGSVDKVDKIRNLIFEGRRYKGKPVGTATIFMKDLRISTNVIDNKGSRAIGTKVSSEVAEQVLEKGLSWTGRAQVVDEWYISQYDPIRNPDGQIIGMLYVGELERMYLDVAKKELTLQFVVVFAVMILLFLSASMLMRNILHPVEDLYDATGRLVSGDLSSRVKSGNKDEIGQLCNAFNHMAEQLEDQRSELERRQITLEKVNEQLKTTNINYMDMLGFVSHELKNPLASAIMGLFTVKDEYIGNLNPAQKKSLDSVAKSLYYFQDMIKNYLDLSRLEKGELNVNKTLCKLLQEVVGPVLEGLDTELRQKKMVVENNIPEQIELIADKNLLRIVYDNLLSNAVKYGKENGKIELNFRKQNEEVVLNVLNEGEGIPVDKLPMLFQKFSRIDTPGQKTKKGTGLGLYICKEIVEKHGGKIWVETEEGKWADFMFKLPVN